MCRKIVWCYIIILTLLDISLNTKLTAQGKSHGTGLSVHEALVEGVSFHEWGKDGAGVSGDVGGGGGAGGGGGGGGAVPLRLDPPALSLGARELGAAHAHTVTLTNTANTTLHLASVAGTTPDFHASFFEAKTLPPDANTTFSVIYLGRREGPVSAHLYIHSSLGVHKYPVSAEGVSSPWGVWPLLGLRVPANATVEPTLTLRNPTPHPVQVSEVYSSGGWVRLSLPGGAETAARDAWLVPPHSARPIVRLRIAPPHQHAHHALTAYVRIKANITGGGLVVGVEARGAPPGEYLDPLHIRLRARGHRDPPHTFSISAGNSADSGARLEASVWGARCLPRPAPPPPPAPHSPPDHAHNGVGAGAGGGEGVRVSVLRAQLQPRQPLAPAAEITLDYEKLWAGYINGGDASTGNGDTANGSGGGVGGVGGVGDGGAWCEGVVRLGGATLPYSLRLLPGTLTLTPAHIDFITADAEQASKEVEVFARNEFLVGVEVTAVSVSEEARAHVSVRGEGGEGGEGGVVRVRAGGEARVCRVALVSRDPHLTLDARLLVRTNLTDYTVPLRVYSGRILLEWEWPQPAGVSGAVGAEGGLHVGAVGTSSTRRILARLRNPAPAPVCVTELSAELPGAHFTLPACEHADEPACRCIGARGSVVGALTLVAPARAGWVQGAVQVRSPHAATRAPLSLSAHSGRLRALPTHLDDAAPYAWARAPLVVESTMALRMRVVGVTPGAGEGEGGADPALQYLLPAAGAGEISAGRAPAGELLYRPELLCEPACYTGLRTDTPEWLSWVRAGAQWAGAGAGGAEGEAGREAARRADRALLAARTQLYTQHTNNISLYLHTTQVVQVPVSGWVRLRWPRLARAGAGWAGLAAVGGVATLRLRVRNPSHSHALLLQPVLGAPPDPPLPDVWEGAECPACGEGGGECVFSLDAFSLEEWRVARGAAGEWRGAGAAGAGGAAGGNSSRALPWLALAPAAEVELKVTFAPRDDTALAAWLYLRNNLTIVEGVQLAGRGAVPSFELAGRRASHAAPILFEVTECDGGSVRRTVWARNTGAVGVRVHEWAVGGAGCAARGFALQPCAPLALQPNQSAPLTLSFTPDYTLARVSAPLRLRAGPHPLSFPLAALLSPRLLARCHRAAIAPRPPFDAALRAAAPLLALALLVLVLGAAALDAERLLRRARALRHPHPHPAAPPRALDLRALAAAPAPPPPPSAPPQPSAPRAAPPRRRKPRKVDPQAESRAFERWRASLRRHDDEDSRSSEDADPPPAPPPPPPATPPRAPSSGDEDAPSSESESSSPPEPDDDESPEEPPRSPPPHAAPPARAPPPPSPRARRPARRPDADPARPRPPGKPHARKDKPTKRRERAPPTPPRCEAPPAEPRPASGVRWGASWSEVVARTAPPSPPPAPLAPIGSDAPRTATDNSLFYFNGDPPQRPDWRPPQPERSFSTPTRDFLVAEEGVGVGVGVPAAVGGGGGGGGGGNYGSIGPAVWGSSLEARAPGAAWPWRPPYAPHNAHGGAVRPPPGFGSSPPGGVGPASSGGAVGGVGSVGGVSGNPAGAIGPPPAAAARGARPFDPFHSLAAIWSRNALDWRADAEEDR